MVPSKILVPVDGSPASLRALDFAIKMTDQNPDTSLVLLNVQNVSAMDMAGAAMGSDWQEAVSQASAKALKEAVGKAEAARIAFKSIVRTGQTAEATDLLRESLLIARELGDAHGIAVCLETFAGLAATGAEPTRAATLFGASDAVRGSIGAQRQPDTQILYERWLARTLADLDTMSYSKHYEDGRALTLDAACRLALRDEAVRTTPFAVDR